MITTPLGQLAEEVSVVIITNRDDEADANKIRSVIAGKGFDFRIVVPTLLGHPFLLTWCHFDIFRKRFSDASFTHFLYLEDDVLITRRNVAYWMRGREALRSNNLIPSFVRYEKKVGDGDLYSTDVTKMVELAYCPQVLLNRSYTYVNFTQPYQGMYLLDRDLMREHLADQPVPGSGGWHIRETAAQGITFTNVPAGFYSRNLVGYDMSKNEIDPDCLVQHLPNNYANDSSSEFGKLRIRDLINRRFSSSAYVTHRMPWLRQMIPWQYRRLLKTIFG